MEEAQNDRLRWRLPSPKRMRETGPSSKCEQCSFCHYWFLVNKTTIYINLSRFLTPAFWTTKNCSHFFLSPAGRETMESEWETTTWLLLMMGACLTRDSRRAEAPVVFCFFMQMAQWWCKRKYHCPSGGTQFLLNEKKRKSWLPSPTPRPLC